MKRFSYNLFAFVMLLCAFSALAGCRVDTQTTPRPAPQLIEQHAATLAIDRFDGELARSADDTMRLNLYAQRWLAVQRAVAYHGTTHRDAFYGSRSYWHTNATRGIGWALDQPGDLNEAFYIATKGNVLIQGDVNKDIEIAGNAIVHILGDLNATLDLKGICEVIVAGNLTEKATIICDGQLQLFVGGNSAGILGSTNSATLIIDGNAGGTLQAGEPATTLTITGNLAADIRAPNNKDAVLTLRVDGYTPTQKMIDLTNAGFTRINATLGSSNTPPGLYPQDENATRPTARWVVLRQDLDDSSKAN